MLYLHKFVKRKNTGLSKSIVSISLFIPLKEKPYGPFKERSLWTSTTKSTDNVIGNRNLQTRICHFAFFFLSFFFFFFFSFLHSDAFLFHKTHFFRKPIMTFIFLMVALRRANASSTSSEWADFEKRIQTDADDDERKINYWRLY